MQFIRPEARSAIWRWREALAGAGLAGLGLYWILGPGALLAVIGWIALLAGLALGWVGTQKARFRSAGQGPGVVLVDEGEVTFMGPIEGGSLALADLERLTLDPTARPPHWVFSTKHRDVLHVPVNAEGSDQLFDAFATLPGLKTEKMLAELSAGGAYPIVIWERRSEPRPVHRLH